MTTKNTHGRGVPRDPFNGFAPTKKSRKTIEAERARFAARAQKWLREQKDEMGNSWEIIDAASSFLEFLPGRDLTEVYNRAWKWFKLGVVPQRNYRIILAPHFKTCPLFK